MEQYTFHDLGVNTRGDPPFIPPEALYIINQGVGTPLEDLIDGYQTLNVKGRELLAYTLEKQDVTGQDGSMFLSANYPEREIEVTYKLEAKDDKEFRQKYELLNHYLSQKQFDFYFYDDDLYQFSGTLTNADKPDPGKNVVKSSFTITCTDPFKRLRDPVTYTNNQHDLRIAEPVFYPTEPDEIDVVFKSNTSSVAITNSKQTITLTGNFKASDKLRITFSSDYEHQSSIYLNGVENLGLLNLTSDFENFKVVQDDIVSVTPNADLTLKLRRREI